MNENAETLVRRSFNLFDDDDVVDFICKMSHIFKIVLYVMFIILSLEKKVKFTSIEFDWRSCLLQLIMKNVQCSPISELIKINRKLQPKKNIISAWTS